jgi:hypothetical protein
MRGSIESPLTCPGRKPMIAKMIATRTADCHARFAADFQRRLGESTEGSFR